MRFLVLCLMLSLGEYDLCPTISGSGSHSPSPSLLTTLKNRIHCALQGWNGGTHMPISPACSFSFVSASPSHNKVRLGQHSLDADGDTGQDVPVRHSIPHPLCNRSLRMPTFLSPDADNSQDLMLCQLREPANTTEAVRVTEEPTEEAKLGSGCLASGWGSTRPDKSLSAKMLQCVDLTLMSSDVCFSTCERLFLWISMVPMTILDPGQPTGDSGTTLLCDRMLQGITSWGGNPCAYPKKPSIFTKVSKCMNWIKANLQITP
nr:prostate-specific antigen-like [Rattus norvegicus]|eukprot:XP_008757702.1 PREDICTED: prostate-specific antigen-like [Rattus norvegicus]